MLVSLCNQVHLTYYSLVSILLISPLVKQQLGEFINQFSRLQYAVCIY